MKKLILLLCSVALFCSCSNDDSSGSTQEDFFNLQEGKLWVYKRYYSNDGVNFTLTNHIDSVRVQGDVLIGNFTYKKVVHNKYVNSSFYQSVTENLRVDSNGHLVNEDGLVLHPGTDTHYQYSKEVSLQNRFEGFPVHYGNINYQLLPNPLQVNVEGSNYLVHSYYGDFVSSDLQLAPNNYVFYQYMRGLGFVCKHEAVLSGNSYFEERLVFHN